MGYVGKTKHRLIHKPESLQKEPTGFKASASKYEDIYETLGNLENIFKNLIEKAGLGIFIDSLDEKLIFHNDSFAEIFGYSLDEIKGKTFEDLVHPDDINNGRKLHHKRINDKDYIGSYEVRGIRKDGSAIYLEIDFSMVVKDDKIIGARSIVRDITEQKRYSDKLIRAKEELEAYVQQQTDELTKANEELRMEREALSHKNIALSEVLNQIAAEKKRDKNNLATNIDKIIMPLFSNLESRLGPTERTLSEVLRNSLRDITNPLVRDLEIQFSKLSPRELQICNMIRNGMTSKEIASVLNTSDGTVRFQRKSIRKKLGITNKSINLISYLKENYKPTAPLKMTLDQPD